MREDLSLFVFPLKCAMKLNTDIITESEVAQSCPTLCNPMDHSPPGSSIHGIFQARVLKWVAISFSRDLPHPGTEPRSSALQADALPSEPQGKPMSLLTFVKMGSMHPAIEIPST